jgi:hypothetical protein
MLIKYVMLYISISKCAIKVVLFWISRRSLYSNTYRIPFTLIWFFFPILATLVTVLKHFFCCEKILWNKPEICVPQLNIFTLLSKCNKECLIVIYCPQPCIEILARYLFQSNFKSVCISFVVILSSSFHIYPLISMLVRPKESSFTFSSYDATIFIIPIGKFTIFKVHFSSSVGFWLFSKKARNLCDITHVKCLSAFTL